MHRHRLCHHRCHRSVGVTPTELQSDLPATILAADSVSAREIGPNAIGASEIAGDAVDRGLDKTSGRIGHANR